MSKPQKTKSNPNNPLCSSMIQAVLEYKELGGSLDISLAELLRLSKEDKDTQKLIRDADRAVSRKGYPEGVLTFHKVERNLEIGRFLSGTEIKLLTLFQSSINQSNLLRISTRDIQAALGADRTAVRNSLKSLLDKGCIVVKRPGTRNISAIYMLNPEISTVGNSKATPKMFWELTGSTYEIRNNKNVVSQFSKPHEEWIRLTATRTYTVGSASDGKPGDPEYLKFNIIHFLDNKKTAPSLGDDEAAAGNDGSDSLDDSDLS